MGSTLKFRHKIIDPNPPGAQHDITLLGDINNDGRNEIIIGGKSGPPNLFWYENPSWARHEIAAANDLEAGGVLVDIAGNGRLDIVAGQQYNHHELYWFENPIDPTTPWTKRVIEDRFNKYHDQTVGDITGDGRPEILFVSQLSGVLGYYTIPDDPYAEPWPQDCFHLIDDNVGPIEGLWIGDIDNDGQTEVIAGTTIYRRQTNGQWIGQPYLDGYEMTRVAVGDLTGNGQLDIVIAEGESNPARLTICWGPDQRVELLRDDLFHPHSLALADFTGDGRLDILVAEMGLGKHPDPKMIIYRNLGNGQFEENIISQEIPLHEAKVADMNNNGRPDIVGKPYDPERHIDIWFNENPTY